MALRRTVTRSLVTGRGARRPRRRVRGRHVVRRRAAGAARPWRDGTSGSDASPAAYAGSDLSLPDSCDDLLRWYVERGVDRVGPYGWGGTPTYYDYADGAAAADDAGRRRPTRRPARPRPPRRRSARPTARPAPTCRRPASTSRTWSRPTAALLFRVQDGDLVTYDVTGAEVRRLASVDLPGSVGSDGDRDPARPATRVVAIAQHAGEGGADRASTEVRHLRRLRPGGTHGRHTVEYDAGLVTARLHDGVVRLVLAGRAAGPRLRDARTSTPPSARPPSATASWCATPRSRTGCRPPPSTAARREQLLDCDQSRCPTTATSLGTITVVGFDAAAPDAPSATGLAVDTDLAYASTDQLYLATSPFDGGVSAASMRRADADARLRRTAPVTARPIASRRRPTGPTSTPSTSTASTPRTPRPARSTG